MTPTGAAETTRSLLWFVLLALLLALRLPAFIQPSGSDQSLYAYVGQTIRDGGVPYVDAWDQKPPGIHFVYAALGAVTPPGTTAALADFVGAGLMAWALVVLGGRAMSPDTGLVGAATYLLLSHPSLARMSGVYVRGQCEVFIALCVTGALCLLWPRERSTRALFIAGVLFGGAFWLKYNAVVYALPLAVALITAGATPPGSRRLGSQIVWMAAGFAAVALTLLGYFAVNGALQALWRATVDYNLAYSGETYNSVGALAYVFQLPLGRARADLLWFVGGLGALLVVLRYRHAPRLTAVLLAWLIACVLSIAINGARDLPQYFVQAAPALALSFAAGRHVAASGPTWLRVAATVAVIVGLWRVGSDPVTFAGLRWGGMPQLAANLGHDVRHAIGRIDRAAYLARFTGGPKYDAVEVEALTRYVRETTAPADRILVFGFSPAVYVESGRRSASRFFWSRPVVLEFAASEERYGSAGLLADLERTGPALIALQRRDWHPDVADSIDFFSSTPILATWLERHYEEVRVTPLFSVWRRMP
jgi:hypothetical protein